MPFRDIGTGTLLSPTPVVMVTCASKAAKPNIITLAWAGTICSDPSMVSISIRPERHSYKIVEDSGEFVVNLVDQRIVKACDYCGVVSGRDKDKFAECGLSAEKVPGLDHAPAIAEAPLYLACKVDRIIPLGSHAMFLGKVIRVGAQESLFDKDDRLRLDKAGLIAFAHGNYYSLGDRQGFFGYSVARPEVLKRRMAE